MEAWKRGKGYLAYTRRIQLVQFGNIQTTILRDKEVYQVEEAGNNLLLYRPMRESSASALRRLQSCSAVLLMLNCLFCFLRQVFNDRSISEESFHVMEQLTSTRNTRTETASFTWTKMVNLSNENKPRSRFTPFDKIHSTLNKSKECTET